MSYFRNNRVPEYAAYGGVLSDEAYGRANGGVPYEEAYGKKRNVNGTSENRPTLREQLEANWQKIKEQEKEENTVDDDTIGTQYAENTYTTTATDADYVQTNPNTSYILSEDMRALLRQKESGNDYTKINPTGGGIGALGGYQIRKGGLIDAGYINDQNQWTGKEGINSLHDFINDPTKQEKVLDDFMYSKYNQLKNNGSFNYLELPIHGLVADFVITETGLLAASHREGARAVYNYLSSLEKDDNGQYYIDYDKIQDPMINNQFRHIETRLREFEK